MKTLNETENKIFIHYVQRERQKRNKRKLVALASIIAENWMLKMGWGKNSLGNDKVERKNAQRKYCKFSLKLEAKWKGRKWKKKRKQNRQLPQNRRTQYKIHNNSNNNSKYETFIKDLYMCFNIDACMYWDSRFIAVSSFQGPCRSWMLKNLIKYKSLGFKVGYTTYVYRSIHWEGLLFDMLLKWLMASSTKCYRERRALWTHIVECTMNLSRSTCGLVYVFSFCVVQKLLKIRKRGNGMLSFLLSGVHNTQLANIELFTFMF